MLEFGSFQLDPDRRELLRDGKILAVQAKLFDTLVLLAENRDRVVEKQELLDSVWPDTYVEESTLFQTVSALRKVLGAERQTDTAASRQSRVEATGSSLRLSNGSRPSPPLDIGQGRRSQAPHRGRLAPQESVQRSAPEPSASKPSEIRIESVEGPSPALTQKESPEPRARRWHKAAVGLAVAVMMLLGVALWRSFETGRPEPMNLRIKQLTSLEGVEWQPGWSPDGRSFAYAGTAFGSTDIFVAATLAVILCAARSIQRTTCTPGGLRWAIHRLSIRPRARRERLCRLSLRRPRAQARRYQPAP